MTVTETDPPAEGRSVPTVAGDDAAMRAWAEELVARARDEGVELTGDNGLLTGLVRQVLQTGLEVEMSDHLGYERHAPQGKGTGNSRNGSYPKTVTTDIGKVDLRVHRDRNASFEPVTVPKGQRRLDGLAGQVISPGKTLRARAVFWRPVSPSAAASESAGDDIAGLELE